MAEKFPDMLPRGRQGICAYCVKEFEPVEGQKVRPGDWDLILGYCGASSITIIPHRFWNPFTRRKRVRAGKPCSRKPDSRGNYPYNPGDDIHPQLTPVDILSDHITK